MRVLHYAIIFITLLAVGCKNPKADKVDVLSLPPYKSISDSIVQFPNDPVLYANRAQLLSQNNQHLLATPDYKKLWELVPNESTAEAYISNLLLTDKVTEAIRLLEQFVQQYPEYPEFKRRLGEAYLQNGEGDKAMMQYDNMLKADSNNFEAWFEKGLLLAQLKDTAAAIKALEKSYSIQPLQLNGISLANLYAETKNQKALTLSDEMLAKDTARELTDAVFVKGVYYANTGNIIQALETFEECINRDWKFTEAYIEKGIILFEQKNIDEALKTFALAAKVSTTSADAYYWLGRCFETIGKKEEALDNYYRAVALDRNFTEARQALKRLKQ